MSLQMKSIFENQLNTSDFSVMDIEFYELYKDRYVSSLFNGIYERQGLMWENTLGMFILSRMNKRWKQRSEDFNAEYNPIDNYHLTEVTEETGDNTLTNTGTVSTENGVSNDIYAFNSNTAQHSTESGSDSTTTNDLTNSSNHRIDKTVTKNGKIGYISSQTFPQLIRTDIELWGKSDLIKQIYDDVAELLFIEYYGNSIKEE